MPCESCNAQFTVFKRKKSCNECRRLYCNQCLVKRKEKTLCDRCVIFTTRPLSKVDLLKLKPKDLIFYLQSKHISTTGCVEKEELVNLVLIHVNNTNGYSSAGSSDGMYSNETDNDEHFSNPFDQIKQTCQNLFTSFTDKIASDLNLDIKPTVNSQNQNIFSQPRASSKNINTFNNNDNTTPQSGHRTCPQAVPICEKFSVGREQFSGPTSPAYSIQSNSSENTSSSGPSGITINRQCGDIIERIPSGTLASSTATTLITSTVPIQTNIPSVHINRIKVYTPIVDIANNSLNCECSDDEMINTFNAAYNKRKESSGINRIDANKDDIEAGPSGTSSSKASSSVHKNTSESSNASSFEELGAVGGISSDTENWQIIGDSHSSVNNVDNNRCQNSGDICRMSETNLSDTQFQNPHSSSTQISQPLPQPPTLIDNTRPRRLIRRRSDSCIESGASNHENTSSLPDDVDGRSHLIGHNNNDDNDDVEDTFLRKRTKTSCIKCGKSRGNLKRHVTKFRRQLENSNTSECEIKEKLDAFLLYLENLNHGSVILSSDSDSLDDDHSVIPMVRVAEADLVDEFMDDSNDGIHVYGIDQIVEKKPRQLICLGDYEDSSDLDLLSVKQLKQLLMLNRVDFKGCCEKTELLERAKRLWNDNNTSPAVEKLPTDDLCKICMDAPIECVILECGHMATCTGCGKVLSECPICRQYIVRVVRFFRA